MLLAEEYTEANEQGAETDLPFLVLHLAAVEAWAGNFELAERYCDHGYAWPWPPAYSQRYERVWDCS